MQHKPKKVKTTQKTMKQQAEKLIKKMVKEAIRKTHKRAIKRIRAKLTLNKLLARQWEVRRNLPKQKRKRKRSKT